MKKNMVYIATLKCANTSIQRKLRELWPNTKNVYRNPRGCGYAPNELTEDEAIPTAAKVLSGGASWRDILPRPTPNSPVVIGFWKNPVWESDVPRDSMGDFLTRDDDIYFNSDNYVWTVVRNPWHRVASAYTYLNDIKAGCHGGTLGLTFREYVLGVTSSAFPDICPHERPERYVEKKWPGWFKSVLPITALGNKTIPLHPELSDGKIFHYPDIIGAAYLNESYRDIMKKCSKAGGSHTQRWENSSLFEGLVTIRPPTVQQARKGFADFLDTVGPGAVEFADLAFKSAIMNEPDCASAFVQTEHVGSPHHLDMVVKFEELQGGIEKVCSDLCIPTFDVPHLNDMQRKNKERFYEQMYENDDVLINAIRDFYAYETNTFGYEFGTSL